MKDYDVAACAVVHRTKEKWGTLHCMASGMPLKVMGYEVPSAEHLYQALRTTDAEVQAQILQEPNPYIAKHEIAHAYPTLPSWDNVKVEAMRYTLRTKWMQAVRFRNVLEDTGTLTIVERSTSDPFWGAISVTIGTLRGGNLLGELLMELRAEVRGEKPPRNLTLDSFLLFGLPLTMTFSPVTLPETPALLFDLEP